MKYPTLLTEKEVLRLLRYKHYKVCIQKGVITNAKGLVVNPFTDEENSYLFVRLYSNHKRKAIAVHKLVWMAKTMQVVPPQFEIHHRDEDPQNNSWSNLLCLHKLDHRKIHDEVPF